MDEFIKLACPVCGGVLSKQNGFYSDAQGHEHIIEEGIPVLLPASEDSGGAHYAEHYSFDAEMFDYFAKRECKATAHDERRLREYIISLAPRKAQFILDVGSGSAWVANHFLPMGKKVVSMDIALANVKKALGYYPHENHLGVVGDALAPPFPPGTFDLIIASELIEHVTEPDVFVEKMTGILRPGGMLIISTPYQEKIEYYICVHCNKPTPKNAHLHSFDEEKLLSLYKGSAPLDKNHYTFGNKALLLLRTYPILGLLPFRLWKIADTLSNLLINRKNHLIATFERKDENRSHEA